MATLRLSVLAVALVSARVSHEPIVPATYASLDVSKTNAIRLSWALESDQNAASPAASAGSPFIAPVGYELAYAVQVGDKGQQWTNLPPVSGLERFRLQMQEVIAIRTRAAGTVITSGTFRLALTRPGSAEPGHYSLGAISEPIAFDATITNVTDAINGLSGLGVSGPVTVERDGPDPQGGYTWRVTFQAPRQEDMDDGTARPPPRIEVVEDTFPAGILPGIDRPVSVTKLQPSLLREPLDGRGPAGARVCESVDVLGEPCTHVVTGLLPGLPYMFRARALYDDAGSVRASAWSVPSKPVTIPLPFTSSGIAGGVSQATRPPLIIAVGDTDLTVEVQAPAAAVAGADPSRQGSGVPGLPQLLVELQISAGPQEGNATAYGVTADGYGMQDSQRGGWIVPQNMVLEDSRWGSDGTTVLRQVAIRGLTPGVAYTVRSRTFAVNEGQAAAIGGVEVARRLLSAAPWSGPSTTVWCPPGPVAAPQLARLTSSAIGVNDVTVSWESPVVPTVTGPHTQTVLGFALELAAYGRGDSTGGRTAASLARPSMTGQGLWQRYTVPGADLPSLLAQARQPQDANALLWSVECRDKGNASDPWTTISPVPGRMVSLARDLTTFHEQNYTDGPVTFPAYLPADTDMDGNTVCRYNLTVTGLQHASLYAVRVRALSRVTTTDSSSPNDVDLRYTDRTVNMVQPERAGGGGITAETYPRQVAGVYLHPDFQAQRLQVGPWSVSTPRVRTRRIAAGDSPSGLQTGTGAGTVPIPAGGLSAPASSIRRRTTVETLTAALGPHQVVLQTCTGPTADAVPVAASVPVYVQGGQGVQPGGSQQFYRGGSLAGIGAFQTDSSSVTGYPNPVYTPGNGGHGRVVLQYFSTQALQERQGSGLGADDDMVPIKTIVVGYTSNSGPGGSQGPSSFGPDDATRYEQVVLEEGQPLVLTPPGGASWVRVHAWGAGGGCGIAESRSTGDNGTQDYRRIYTGTPPLGPLYDGDGDNVTCVPGGGGAYVRADLQLPEVATSTVDGTATVRGRFAVVVGTAGQAAHFGTGGQGGWPNGGRGGNGRKAGGGGGGLSAIYSLPVSAPAGISGPALSAYLGLPGDYGQGLGQGQSPYRRDASAVSHMLPVLVAAGGGGGGASDYCCGSGGAGGACVGQSGSSPHLTPLPPAVGYNPTRSTINHMQGSHGPDNGTYVGSAVGDALLPPGTPGYAGNIDGGSYPGDDWDGLIPQGKAGLATGGGGGGYVTTETTVTVTITSTVSGGGKAGRKGAMPITGKSRQVERTAPMDIAGGDQQATTTIAEEAGASTEAFDGGTAAYAFSSFAAGLRAEAGGGQAYFVSSEASPGAWLAGGTGGDGWEGGGGGGAGLWGGAGGGSGIDAGGGGGGSSYVHGPAVLGWTGSTPTPTSAQAQAQPTVVLVNDNSVALTWPDLNMAGDTAADGGSATADGPRVRGYVVESRVVRGPGQPTAQFAPVWTGTGQEPLARAGLALHYNSLSSIRGLAVAVITGLAPSTSYSLRVTGLRSMGPAGVVPATGPSQAVAVNTTAPQYNTWSRMDVRGLQVEHMGRGPAVLPPTPSSSSGGANPNTAAADEATSPSPLRGASLSPLGGQLYLFGGHSEGIDCTIGGPRPAGDGDAETCQGYGGLRSDTWRLDPVAKTWWRVPLATGSDLPPGRERHASAVIGDRLFILSGRAEPQLTNSTANAYGQAASQENVYHNDMWVFDGGYSLAGPQLRHTAYGHGAAIPGSAGSRSSVHVGGTIMPAYTPPGSSQAPLKPLVDISCPVTANSSYVNASCGTLPETVQAALPLLVLEDGQTPPTIASLTAAHAAPGLKVSSATVPRDSCVLDAQVFITLLHPCPGEVSLTLVAPGRQAYRAAAAGGGDVASGDIGQSSTRQPAASSGQPIGQIGSLRVPLVVGAGSGSCGSMAATASTAKLIELLAVDVAVTNGQPRLATWEGSLSPAVAATILAAAEGGSLGTGTATLFDDAAYMDAAGDVANTRVTVPAWAMAGATRNGTGLGSVPGSTAKGVVGANGVTVYPPGAVVADGSAVDPAACPSTLSSNASLGSSNTSLHAPVTVTVPLVSGHTRPHTGLAEALRGTIAAGTWALEVRDSQGNAVSGLIRSWGIVLHTAPCERSHSWARLYPAKSYTNNTAAGNSTLTGAASFVASYGSQLASIPPPRVDASSAVLGDRYWFLWGGTGLPGYTAGSSSATVSGSSASFALPYYSDLWRYDVVFNSWTQVAPLASQVPSSSPILTSLKTGALQLSGALGPGLGVTGLITSRGLLAIGGQRRPGQVTYPGLQSPASGCWVGDDAPALPSDQHYACSSPDGVTVGWSFGRRTWARVHPEPAAGPVFGRVQDGTAACVGQAWCRVPGPRSYAAIAVVGEPGSSSHARGVAVPTVVVVGGQDPSTGHLLGDVWSMPLVEEAYHRPSGVQDPALLEASKAKPAVLVGTAKPSSGSSSPIDGHEDGAWLSRTQATLARAGSQQAKDSAAGRGPAAAQGDGRASVAASAATSLTGKISPYSANPQWRDECPSLGPDSSVLARCTGPLAADGSSGLCTVEDLLQAIWCDGHGQALGML